MSSPAKECNHRNKIAIFHRLGKLALGNTLIIEELIVTFLVLLPGNTCENMLVAGPKHSLRSYRRQIIAFADPKVQDHGPVRIRITFGEFRKASAKWHSLIAAQVDVVQHPDG